MFHIILVLTLKLLLLQLIVAQVNFTYNSFRDVSSNDLLLSGNATISSSQLQLTSDNFFSYGRAVKSQAITFCSKNSLTSFTSDFTFTIQSKIANNQNADGFAFFIAPSTISPSSKSYGRWLALMEPSDNGKLSNKLVAVEFDTYPNQPPDYPEFQDPDGNHVGVNVNGVISQNLSSLTAFGIRLGAEGRLAARIDYDAVDQKLAVYVSKDLNLSKMTNPVLEHNINLCAYISSDSYVGFSAGAGSANVDFHNIYSWTFSSRSSTTRINSSIPPVEGVSSGKGSNSFKIPFFIAVALAGFLLFLVFALYFLLRRDPAKPESFSFLKKFQPAHSRSQQDSLVMLPRGMSYSDIVLATHNFNSGNLLGSGGFGSVYKGILPKDSTVVAVKRLSKKSNQGEREFLAEVKIISSLSHKNLVKLRGWCRKSTELILVYEFMEQGSVENALFENSSVLLVWSARFKIICGLASALVYLHEEWEQPVLHRDIKCSNVMLDGDFNPRLGDFGLARVLEPENTSKTTTMAGTPGYIAPEVGHTYKFTTASDVYSFGIVVLEIVCGKKVVSDQMLLVPWVEEMFESGVVLGAVDPRLHELYDPDEVMRVLKLAMRCIESDPRNRPSMREALHTLITRNVTR